MGNDSTEPPVPGRGQYEPGQVIDDRYKLVRPLGRGGMGVVWIAHSEALDVDVAVKVLRTDLAGTAVAERMAQEARAAARLGHPAMVRVFDFGKTAAGDPFLVMELLHGETLGDVLDRKSRISPVVTLQTLLPIADGLGTAHDRGIIHRDLKPENVFLARDPVGRVQPKLLDFGIAKLEEGDIDRQLTAAGAVLGSPDYMSPEQAQGRNDIDERADVFALCVVLYESMTGERPFVGDNYNALLHAIINEDPVPITWHSAGDEALWRVISRGLAKQRDDRWRNMWELGEALALWLYEHGVREDITKRSLRGSWLEAGLSGVQMVLRKSVPPMERETDPGDDLLDPVPSTTRKPGGDTKSADPISVDLSEPRLPAESLSIDVDVDEMASAMARLSSHERLSRASTRAPAPKRWGRALMGVLALAGIAGALGWWWLQRPRSVVSEPVEVEPAAVAPIPPPVTVDEPAVDHPGLTHTGGVDAGADAADAGGDAESHAKPRWRPRPRKPKERDFGF